MKYFLCLFALAACAPQEPVFKPVAVDIPVAAACKTHGIAKPDFAMNHIAAGDDVAAKTRSALIEITQRKAYEAEIESQLILCQ